MEKITMGIDELNVEMIEEKYPQLKMTKIGIRIFFLENLF